MINRQVRTEPLLRTIEVGWMATHEQEVDEPTPVHMLVLWCGTGRKTSNCLKTQLQSSNEESSALCHTQRGLTPSSPEVMWHEHATSIRRRAWPIERWAASQASGPSRRQTAALVPSVSINSPWLLRNIHRHQCPIYLRAVRKMGNAQGPGCC